MLQVSSARLFLVKRGLMLGATGRSAYFPGTIVQPGAYAKEREIFSKFGVILIEFPVDIALWAVGIILCILTLKQQFRLREAENEILQMLNPASTPMAPTDYIYFQLGSSILFLVIIVIAWRRRTKLQRL